VLEIKDITLPVLFGFYHKDCIMSSSISTEVYLVIYDLSMGTAHQLSSIFLGPENSIPMVPHTGVVAYNNEYFFSSSGVNRQNPNTFRNTNGGLLPLEMKYIGKTTKTQVEFENWLYTGNDIPLRFHGSKYKLLEHNCNTFSDYVLRVGLGFNAQNSVPEWILDLPQKVMSSLLGSLLASSMENMQPFGNENTRIRRNDTPQTFSTPPVPPSWHQNSSFIPSAPASVPPVPLSWQQQNNNNSNKNISKSNPEAEKIQTLSI